jgi:hypothetical protein
VTVALHCGIVTELEVLLRLVETLAALKAEGRLTLLRFAGGWRVGLGPGDVMGQPVHPTLRAALEALVIDQVVP